MKRMLLVGVALGAAALFAQFKTAPVWDLAQSAGAKSAAFKAAGRLPLSAKDSLEIPCAVIEDFSAFTVHAKLKFNTLDEPVQLGLFSQLSADAGWSLSIMNFGRVGSPITLTVDGVRYNAGWFRAKPGSEHTFTVTARKGLVVVYMDARPLKRFFTRITPASTPLKVGYRTGRHAEMKDVELRDLKIFGPDELFYAPGESRDFAVGYKGGKGWMVAVPAKETQERPRLLYYGDSISHGYSGALSKRLKDRAYLYHWSGFVGGLSINEQAFLDVAKLARYDMIVFNNGLHALHWTPEKVSDAQIADVTRAMVRAFRKGAPQAKLVWLSTTPHTARKGPDGKVAGLGELNDIVLRINRIAEAVMKEEKVDIIDGYGLLADRLEWASGDQYHWKAPAYDTLAAAVAETFLKTIANR